MVRWHADRVDVLMLGVCSSHRRNEILEGSQTGCQKAANFLPPLASTHLFGNHQLVDAPGLFYHLVKESALSPEALAPLMTILPPEEFVSTNIRDGEAYDSLRWPVAFDAEIATIAAKCFDEPPLHQALHSIEQARRDRTRLRELARASTAQSLAAIGGDADLFRMIWPDATLEDLALFSAPLLAAETAEAIESLCHAHYNAADGLYAYHVHRRLPGPSAPAAARLVKRALTTGKLHPDELVALAIALVKRGPNRND